MDYKEVLEKARGNIVPYCKACPVCNGKACGNSMPGPGSKGPGNGAARNYDAWQKVLGKADERGAEVGAARVNDCGGLAERELPVGGEIGGDHPDGAFPAAQTELHVAYKSGGGRVEVYTLRLHAVASEENADLF